MEVMPVDKPTRIGIYTPLRGGRSIPPVATSLSLAGNKGQQKSIDRQGGTSSTTGVTSGIDISIDKVLVSTVIRLSYYCNSGLRQQATALLHL
jgi:hypothetical protein